MSRKNFTGNDRFGSILIKSLLLLTLPSLEGCWIRNLSFYPFSTKLNSEVSESKAEKKSVKLSSQPKKSEIIKIFRLGNNKLLSVDKSGAVRNTILSDDNSQGKNSQEVKTNLLYNFTEQPTVATFHEKTKLLALAFTNRVVLLEIGAPQSVKVFSDIRGRFLDLTFHPDGKSLLLTVGDNKVYRWRFKADNQKIVILGQPEKELERYIGHSAIVSSLVYHPYGRVFFSGDWSGSLIAWLSYDADPYNGRYDRNLFTGRFYADETAKEVRAPQVDEAINNLAVNTSGEWLAMTLSDGSLELWQIRGFRKIAEQLAHSGPIQSLSFEKNTISTLGRDGFLKQWNFKKNIISLNKSSYKLLPTRQKQTIGAISHVVDSKNQVWIGDRTGKIYMITNWENF
jgi:WD40 repeat protein